MTRTIILAVVFLTTFCAFSSQAQQRKASTTASSKTKTPTQTQTETKPAEPPSEVDKNIDKVDTTMGKAKATVGKTQQTVKDFIGMFGSKAPNEGSIVVAAIEFEDANLGHLVEALQDRKEVKRVSMEYTDGTAIIKLILKAKAEADFWNELPKEVKDVFKMKSKKENNILVEYKPLSGGKPQLAQN